MEITCTAACGGNHFSNFFKWLMLFCQLRTEVTLLLWHIIYSCPKTTVTKHTLPSWRHSCHWALLYASDMSGCDVHWTDLISRFQGQCNRMKHSLHLSCANAAKWCRTVIFKLADVMLHSALVLLFCVLCPPSCLNIFLFTPWADMVQLRQLLLITTGCKQF